jgi:nicotinamide-nucleotide amidase
VLLMATGRSLYAFMFAVLGCAGAWAEDPVASSPRETVDYMIVVTGAELLSGAYPDGHTFFLTRTLYPLGYHCVGSMTVDDRSGDIREALRYAESRVPLVIVTGGLGPTDNDITRETLEEFTGIPLAEQNEVVAAMEKRFRTTRDQLRPNLRKQARVPVSGTYLKSSQGTAVGLVFEKDQHVIVSLPGPPRELQPMVRDELVPYLSRRFGTHTPGCSITLRFVGLGQSQIDQTLDDKVHLPADVIVTSQFDGGGRVDFGFQLRTDTPENRGRLDSIKQKVVGELGGYIYADDPAVTLEDRIVQRMETRHVRIALAEVGSGGSLIASLSASAAAGRIRPEAYVATSNDELHRLLACPDDAWRNAKDSEEQAVLLAARVSEMTRCDCVVAVGEVENRDNAPSVAVVVQTPGGTTLKLRMAAAPGDPSRARLVTAIWDQLRKQLN